MSITWRNETRKIETLTPAAYNPRKFTEKQLADLTASLDKFALADPIIINADGKVIGGHLRLRALKAKGVYHADVRVPDRQLTDLEEKELNIRLNKNQGEFDEALLADFDMGFLKDIGFSADELEEIYKSAMPEPEAQQLFSQEQIKDAIIENWREYFHADFLKCVMSPHQAMAEFNKLASGKAAGYWISSMFNPHRLATSTRETKKNVFDAFIQADDSFVRNGAKFISEFSPDMPYDRFVKQCGSGWGGLQVCFEFRPKIARDLYLKYVPKGGDILDPCHGWGGRAVGWLSTNLPGWYTGCDPAKRTSEGVGRMVSFLKQSTAKGQVLLIPEPFESVPLEDSSFDYALTSPPYYDTEKYDQDNPDEVFNKFPTYEAFKEGFLRVMIEKVMRALRPGGRFTLNVGINTYSMKADVIEIVTRLGYPWAQETDFSIGGSGIGDRTFDEDADIAGEPFITITKPQ